MTWVIDMDGPRARLPDHQLKIPANSTAMTPTAVAALPAPGLSAAKPAEATQHFLDPALTIAAEPTWKLMMLYGAS
jgi:hypothetical protein